MRDDYLTTWVSEDERLTLIIEKCVEAHSRDHKWGYRVTVFDGLVGPPLAVDCPAQWIPRTLGGESEHNGDSRLGRLLVELDDEVAGPTYTLYFACEAADPSAYEGLTWLPVFWDVSPSSVRCLPELGPGYMAALLGPYDDAVSADLIPYGWAEPYSSFRILEYMP